MEPPAQRPREQEVQRPRRVQEEEQRLVESLELAVAEMTFDRALASASLIVAVEEETPPVHTKVAAVVRAPALVLAEVGTTTYERIEKCLARHPKLVDLDDSSRPS